MDHSATSDGIVNDSTHASLEYNYMGNNSNIIDLGLSLRALQPEAYYDPSAHENYEVLVDWQQPPPQSKQCWSYVKVNMDGVMVGRKICLLDNMDYLSLALQLEDMFGKQSMRGLRLFDDDSEFSLFYKDKDEHYWRMVGDVPWKVFTSRVKRLRIACKVEDHQIVSSSN